MQLQVIELIENMNPQIPKNPSEFLIYETPITKTYSPLTNAFSLHIFAPLFLILITI